MPLSERDRRALLRFTDPETLDALGPLLTAHSGYGECKGFCPSCEDPKTSRTPSAGFNVRTNRWSCRGKCHAGGTITRLIRELESTVIDIQTREPIKVNLPSQDALDTYYSILMGKPNLLQYLHDERGLSDESIEEWCIGWLPSSPRPNSYVIPVYGSDDKTLEAVRLYKRTVKHGKPKMIYWGRPGRTFLFNSAILAAHDEVVVCAGEWDCILNLQHGIPTLTHTAGEGTWMHEWTPMFKGKDVWLCYDDDITGINGSNKAARSLEGIARNVYIMHLDTGIEGGDITDFYVKLQRDADDFRKLMKAAAQSPFSTKVNHVAAPTVGAHVDLSESQNADLVLRPIELDVQIAGKVTPAFSLPKRVVAKCSQNKGPVCKVCPMKRYEGEMEFETRADDPMMLQFLNSGEASKQKLLVRACEARCESHITFSVQSFWSVEQLLATQSMASMSTNSHLPQQPITRTIYAFGYYNTPTNSNIHVVGQSVPDPSNQRGTIQAWGISPLQIDIDKFSMSEELRDALAVFQPNDGQTVMDKCLEIASDLEVNITRIYERKLVHLAMDLVWHSPIGFHFMGRREHKGWLEGLVVGDTRTGKSEIAERLCEHYRAGRVYSCEGATFAGLVGGSQQTDGKNWAVTWGHIPLNDKRLVVLDEVSGLKDKNIIERMSSVRSSGIAQITTIASSQVGARTRLLWLTNPVKGKSLAETSGIRAIKDIFPQPEDIARFDFAVAARSDEVASNVINRVHHQRVQHEYTSDLCSQLLMWVWSRKPEQIKWTGKSELEILKAAEEIGKRYVEDPPLIQIANVRIKLARLAAAFAARTFSTDAKAETIRVSSAHVHAAVEFLDTVYSTDAMGYAQYSEARSKDYNIALSKRNEVWEFLMEHEGVFEALDSLREAPFKAADLDGADDEFPDGTSVLRWLRERKMVRRSGGNFWSMEAPLVQVLKKLEEGNG